LTQLQIKAQNVVLVGLALAFLSHVSSDGTGEYVADGVVVLGGAIVFLVRYFLNWTPLRRNRMPGLETSAGVIPLHRESEYVAWFRARAVERQRARVA
jgi:hypothetical protein